MLGPRAGKTRIIYPKPPPIQPQPHEDDAEVLVMIGGTVALGVMMAGMLAAGIEIS